MNNSHLFKIRNNAINIIFILFWIGGILSFSVENDIFTENNWAGEYFYI